MLIGGGPLVPRQCLLRTPRSQKVASSHQECVVDTAGRRAFEPHQGLIQVPCLRKLVTRIQERLCVTGGSGSFVTAQGLIGALRLCQAAASDTEGPRLP
jgi:hypothetical protein